MCNSGYDYCSMERDRLNSQMGEYRYFCSETYRNEGYDSSTPSYDDTYYSGGEDCLDYDNDGYCDENYDGSYDDNYYDDDYYDSEI